MINFKSEVGLISFYKIVKSKLFIFNDLLKKWSIVMLCYVDMSYVISYVIMPPFEELGV